MLSRMSMLLLALTATAAAQDGAMLGSVACPNGHSDCSSIGSTPNYCAEYQGTRECWPCIFCTFFQDSVDGSCQVCGDTSIDPIDTGVGGEAPGEADTPAPTPAPTDPTDPTTTAAAETSSAFSCPRNCGTPENGGGTCRPNGKCLSCNSNRLLSNGACYQSISCNRREVQTGSRAGAPCRCLQDQCHFCQRDVTGDVCRVCRDGWYLLNDQCVESCPAGMASSGVSLFKRRCLAPFTCQSGRITTMNVTFGCKCANDDNTAVAKCHVCEHRAGEFGQHCLKCNNGQFLHNNRCQADCAGIAGVIEYTPGNYGRECRAPFTCTDRLDEDGNPCKCNNVLRRAGCRSCRWDGSGNTCLD